MGIKRPKETNYTYLTIREASSHLGKCTKTVRNYIHLGVLRAKRFRGCGKGWWIRKDDVDGLKKIGDMKFRPSDIYDFLQTVKVRLSSLEKKIDFLLHVNDLEIGDLRDTKIETLFDIYKETRKYVDEGIFDLTMNQIDSWSWVFLQLSEIEFSRLAGPAQDPQPWRPFHRLCIALMQNLRSKPEFAESIRMQDAYRLLEKGRRNLSRGIVVFIESGLRFNSPSMERLSEFLTTSDDSLDRYIQAQLLNPRTY
jgi:excisionase family DNA binding protein